jgi:hypothetical protein
MYNSPLDTLLQNKKALSWVGIGGGVFALLSGFVVMAGVTVSVLNRNAANTFAAAPTAPAAVVPSTEPTTQPTVREVNTEPAVATLTQFLKYIQNSQFEQAHNLTSNVYQARVSIDEFRAQLVKAQMKNWKSFDYNRGAATVQTRNYRCKVGRANGKTLNFEIEMTDEDDGWKINRFDIEQ